MPHAVSGVLDVQRDQRDDASDHPSTIATIFSTVGALL